MEYALEERIGDPALFTGRKEELDYFLRWLAGIKEKKSQSSAIMGRRKMGKTAILERLFNITFAKNDKVIPFYYEVKERKFWVGDFCIDFFLTFIYQYIAFKTRKIGYLKPEQRNDLQKVKTLAESEGLGYLSGIIESVEYSYNKGNVDILWETVREAPLTIAFRQKEFIVQMIDEFQFLNSTIYWDRAKSDKQLANTFVGGYLSTAESKIAPLLVSGSWVGWLMNTLINLLPARFDFHFLKGMPPAEAHEMAFKYSQFFGVPVSEVTAFAMVELCEGSPFYISSIFRSNYKGKDLTTLKGLTDTVEYETLNPQGKIKSTWMEYLASAFGRVNRKNAKRIVLYLCKHKDREITRAELMKELELDMDDTELETKLEALVMADIIDRGQTNFDYRGVQDNIFEKVFRGVYEKEISAFDPRQIRKEYSAAFDKLDKKFKRLQGKYNYQKGYFAEYLLIEQLRLHARHTNDLLKSITFNLPGDFDFCEYSSVWKYDSSKEYSRSFNVDIFARSQSPADYSVIVEVKSREVRKFSKEEAIEFEKKFEELKKVENLARAIGFVFSRCGFTKEAEEYCIAKKIAYSEDEKWLIPTTS